MEFGFSACSSQIHGEAASINKSHDSGLDKRPVRDGGETILQPARTSFYAGQVGSMDFDSGQRPALSLSRPGDGDPWCQD